MQWSAMVSLHQTYLSILINPCNKINYIVCIYHILQFIVPAIYNHYNNIIVIMELLGKLLSSKRGIL